MTEAFSALFSDPRLAVAAAAAPAAPAPKASPTAANPYAGQWTAKADSGATVATIRIDAIRAAIARRT